MKTRGKGKRYTQPTPRVQQKHQRKFGGKGWRCLGQKMRTCSK